MGLSSNQARFLSLTARQIDLEHRVQQICQRRLKLSNEMQRAARTYNDKTSDRRMFINTADSFSSANNIMGPTTHDNLSDNERYEFITPENLYDNGYHLFVNGNLLDIDATGGVKTPTGAVINYNNAPVNNVGDWYDSGGFSYKVTSKTIVPNPYTINAPVVAGTHSNEVTTAVVTGTANTTTQYTPWVGGSVYQNPSTGVATQTFTRSGKVDTNMGTITKSVPVTQMSMTDLGSSTSTVNINGQVFNQYTYYDYANRQVTRLAIGDVSDAQAIAQLNALANAGTTITDNFTLMRDVNLSNANWGVINDFDGIFDGNLHTISNFNITESSAASNPVGFFGDLLANAKIKGLTLANETITTNCGDASPHSGSYIGGLAGNTASGSSIDNCNITGLNMTVNTTSGTGNIENAGGLVGQSAGTIDKSSVQGTIQLNGGACDSGALVGWVTGGTVSRSFADVDFKVSGAYPSHGYGGGFIGDSNGGTLADCYFIGNIYTNGSATPLTTFFANDTGTKEFTPSNFYWNDRYRNITEYYENGDWTADDTLSGNHTAPSNFGDSTTNVNGTPVPTWSGTYANGNPKLNTAAVNVEQGTFDQMTTTTWDETKVQTDSPGVTTQYTASQYTTGTALTSEELEAGLRDGSIKLAKHADALTQEIITVPGITETFEYVDWRVVPIISEELYEANDEEAQSEYEKTIREVNNQDKKLELEQTSLTTEYNAITNEKEAVEKIIDNNVKNSFKYFG